jgi:hypothetical protein
MNEYEYIKTKIFMYSYLHREKQISFPFLELTAGIYLSKSSVSNLFTAKGHTGFCELLRGSHVENSNKSYT